jgi:drug/metabolite transporter (DMT)-like permease
MSGTTSTPRWVGVLALVCIATVFGANHIAARVAFDHGANVAAAVAVRSTTTALMVFALSRVSGISMALPAPTARRALVIGALISIQSFCLYSAVARIPVALALLAFNTFPFVLALVSWAGGGERPSRRTLVAMGVALVGLALALDVAGRVGASGEGVGQDLARRLAQIGPGVGFALAAAVAFGCSLHLITRWLSGVDGRVRTLYTMAVVAVVMLVTGSLGSGFSLPRDPVGWGALGLLTLLYGSAITALFTLLPRLGAVNNSAVLNFEPIATLALGWVVLDQTVAPIQLLGALIVVGAIVALTRGRR